jgi:hypothetical protein
VGAKPEVLATQYFRLAGGTVPVNLERLCRRLSLNIVEWPGQPDFTSLLSVLHRMIVVNKNMIYVRRRFSVAHELGHYALGEAGVRFFADARSPPLVAGVRLQRGVPRGHPVRHLRSERPSVGDKAEELKSKVRGKLWGDIKYLL